MHARQPTLRINGCEPSAKEQPGSMRALGVHQRKGRTRVVEYSIDEHLKIRQFERLRFRVINMFECRRDDQLEFLKLST